MTISRQEQTDPNIDQNILAYCRSELDNNPCRYGSILHRSRVGENNKKKKEN